MPRELPCGHSLNEHRQFRRGRPRAVGTVLSMGAFEQRGGGRGGGGGLDNKFANVAESDITALVLRPDSTGMLQIQKSTKINLED